jgi:hypothetical protein
MTIDEQLEILQASKRGEKIEWAFNESDLTWYRVHDNKNFMFNFGMHAYRIAPKPTKVVKYLCWEDCSKQLRWFEDTANVDRRWKLRPAFDMECEVEDDRHC